MKTNLEGTSLQIRIKTSSESAQIVSNRLISQKNAYIVNMDTVYNFKLNLDWKLINAISKVDRFDASWSVIERTEGTSLRQLKEIATIKSVGASTRIEGSKMSDKEVERLLDNLNVSKLKDRDSQEVAGYFTVLDMMADAYQDIVISENSIKGLHNVLLKNSEKDGWHRGDYKQHSNAVEATNEEGEKTIVFRTTPPGFPTEDAMRSLIAWYNNDTDTHPLVKSAIFSYDFVSIHPFQDGNGRLSRLLASLCLLKNGYRWIQYISFEHEIERFKGLYYKRLMECQQNRPHEDVSDWVLFFLQMLNNMHEQLMKKLEVKGRIAQLAPREKSIYLFIHNHSGCRSSLIAKKLGLTTSTTKRILSKMTNDGLITRHGRGASTNYST